MPSYSVSSQVASPIHSPKVHIAEVVKSEEEPTAFHVSEAAGLEPADSTSTDQIIAAIAEEVQIELDAEISDTTSMDKTPSISAEHVDGGETVEVRVGLSL